MNSPIYFFFPQFDLKYLIQIEIRLAKEAGLQIIDRDWIDVEMALNIIDDDSSGGGDLMAGIENMVASMKK